MPFTLVWDLPTITGTIGVSCILLAYFLNLYGYLKTDHYLYLIINLVGGILAAWSSVLLQSLPFTVLETVWSLVSAVALGKKLVQKRA
ncbi:MAG: hypothetical protein AAFR61_06675 [Bacteroidota bacterium]